MDGEWREQELAEGSGSGHGAEGDRAPAFRQQLAEGADHRGYRAARQAEADQQAGRKIEHARRRRRGREVEPERVHGDAGAQHARRAKLVSNGAGERLSEAPQQVLDRDREREHVSAPTVRLRQRREEEAERRARTERQDRDRAPAQHDHDGNSPAEGPGGGCSDVGHGSSGPATIVVQLAQPYGGIVRACIRQCMAATAEAPFEWASSASRRLPRRMAGSRGGAGKQAGEVLYVICSN